MKNAILVKYLIICFILVSCGSGLIGVKTSDIKAFDSNFSGDFKHLSYKDKYRNSGSYSHRNVDMLSLFNIEDKNIKSVNISFSKDQLLIVKYADSSGIKSKTFHGKFTKRGFYQVYHAKENLEIPPLFPIIYSKTYISRIRISLSSNNDLLIDDYYESGGNIFILAGGSFSRSAHHFESIQKNN